MIAKSYNLSMLFHRPEDLPSVWAVHVLDLDVISQGETLQDALKMALEASGMVVRWDVEHRRDPLDRRAPDAFWDKFHDIVLHGQALEGLNIPDEAHVHAVALQAMCAFAFQNADVAVTTPPTRAGRRLTAPATQPAHYRHLLTWPQTATAA